MSELKVFEMGDTTAATGPSAERETRDVRRGVWRLKPNVVLRVEEDGAILFDPDTDALTVVNPTASALLQWQRDHICFDEWCKTLHTHYRNTADLAKIQGDVKGFLDSIAFFTEACDGACD